MKACAPEEYLPENLHDEDISDDWLDDKKKS